MLTLMFHALSQSLNPLVEPIGACGAPGSRMSGWADIGRARNLGGKFSRGGCNLEFGGLKSDLETERHPSEPQAFLSNEDLEADLEPEPLSIAVWGRILPAKCMEGVPESVFLVIQEPTLREFVGDGRAIDATLRNMGCDQMKEF